MPPLAALRCSRRSRSAPRASIEQRHVGDVGVERLAHPLADELDQGVEVELRGEGLPDAVHGRQLGDALARLLDRTRAGKGGADVLADVGEELLVLLGVGELLRVRLDDEGAHRPPLGRERNSEPVFAHLAPELELALRNQLLLPLPRKPLRFAGSEHVGGGPPRLPAAEIDPCVGGRPVDVHLVLPVGPVDQLPLLVEERDEEVVGVHELADDGVHRPVELLHVLGRARELGDPVERRLHLLGAPSLSVGGLELGEPPPRLGELGLGVHRPPIRAVKALRRPEIALNLRSLGLADDRSHPARESSRARGRMKVSDPSTTSLPPRADTSRPSACRAGAAGNAVTDRD